MSWKIALRGVLGELRVDVRFETRASPVVVIGPNGAGKSTLLRAIAGARLGLEGQVIQGDRTLFDSGRGVDVPPHERGIGYVPQGCGLFPHLSVEANVAFGCGRGASARGRARSALARFDAVHLAARLPRALSGGEQQRVALARALAPEPGVLLLDEPLAALDAARRRRMRRALAEILGEPDRQAFVSTHDVRDVRAFGGVVLVIERGEVVQSGGVEALKEAPASDFVAEFFDLD